MIEIATRTPSVTRKPHVSEVTVSLDEFKPDEIAEHLRSLGYCVDGTFSRRMLDELERVRAQRRVETDSRGDWNDPKWEEGAWITQDELSRAGTLLTCGQRDSAREYILGLVSDALGRPL